MDDEYRQFVHWNRYPWCWWCGRDQWQRPRDWHAPWLIERAHIVSSPRRKDARAVVCLCTLCHMRSHGLEVVTPGEVTLPSARVEHMLWLKLRFDPSRYDREFLGQSSVSLLPRARPPYPAVREYYSGRRGGYPSGK